MALALLAFLTASHLAAEEPGKGYKLIQQIKPDNELEFFGAPHVDIVVETYQRADSDNPAYKIVLSSLADPARKELLFQYDRGAAAMLSPDGKWIVINDRPYRGYCEPLLFKHRKGLKFEEIKSAKIRAKTISFFVHYNKLPHSILENMSGEPGCFLEAEMWSEDSQALLLRLAKGRTGEPIWIQSWRCVYDLKSGVISTDLKAMNRGSIQPGKYLAPTPSGAAGSR